jgi:hypothetical protein
MLNEYKKDCPEESVEKIYALKHKKCTKSGEKYIYKNYRSFIPYYYLKTMHIDDKMFMYSKDDRIYITSVQPDGSVRAKKVSLNVENRNKNAFKTKQKRYFTVPKYFFPHVTED